MVETELAGPPLALTEEDEQRLLEESEKGSDSEEQEIELTIDTNEAFTDEEEEENIGSRENQKTIPNKPTLQTKPLAKAWRKRGINGKMARGNFRGRYGLHPRSPSQRPNFRECRFRDVQDPPMRNQPFRLDPTNQPNPMCFAYNLNEKPPPSFGNNQSNHQEEIGNGRHAVQNGNKIVQNGGKIVQNGGKVIQSETFINGSSNNVNVGSHFVNKRLDKHGLFRGRDEPELIMNNLKKEFPNEVKKENQNGSTEIKVEDDSDDSDIEMVAVVDNKKGKKYKAIKVEDEKEVKTRIKEGVAVHASHNSFGEQIHLSDRIREFYTTRRQEITGKRPLISPQFMKGRIENPKYKTLKRTIPEEEIQNDEVKKAKTQGNYQVEISGLPTDWIEEGVEKITSIANAYGDSTSDEMPTLKVFQNPDNSFVIIFKKVQYAVKMYEMLNQREIDQFVVKVTEPHPFFRYRDCIKIFN